LGHWRRKDHVTYQEQLVEFALPVEIVRGMRKDLGCHEDRTNNWSVYPSPSERAMHTTTGCDWKDSIQISKIIFNLSIVITMLSQLFSS
jgi:hypothetical protein